MEKLLHWSIANSHGDQRTRERVGEPDPKLLAQLFGNNGPGEPTLMKEAMDVIMNPEAELKDKLIAFDNFEMLIENLDNANIIENLKLWHPLLQQLDSLEVGLRIGALSSIGTACQNNVKAQDDFLKHDGGLQKIIKLAGDVNEHNEVREKALYALSNLIRNHPVSSKYFCKLNGLEIIPPIICDTRSSSKLKMRALSLLSAFLTSSAINEGLINVLRRDGIIEAVISCLTMPFDVYVADRALNVLAQLIGADVQFTDGEKEKLHVGMLNIESKKDKLNEDDLQIVSNFYNMSFVKKSKHML